MAKDDQRGLAEVTLNKTQRDERGRQLAKAQIELDEVIAKKATNVTVWNAEIKNLEADVSRLSKEVDTGVAHVPKQPEMFEGAGEEPAIAAAG